MPAGYGVSSGKPSEKNLYSDIQAAWDALRTRYGISPENIILYGQSIGGWGGVVVVVAVVAV